MEMMEMTENKNVKVRTKSSPAKATYNWIIAGYTKLKQKWTLWWNVDELKMDLGITGTIVMCV
jgi:hypothetical protein